METEPPLILKHCPDCDQDKPLKDFNINHDHKDGKGTYCKPCARARMRTVRLNNPNYERNVNYLKRYGETLESIKAMFVAQGGLCAMCGEAMTFKEACVDHCHEFGHIRGLVHRVCNLLEARCREDRARWDAIARYVDEHNKPVV